MAQLHEWMFYETMWRIKTEGSPFPMPWWIQQYFRYWIESYDSGLFSSKEAAFASNANYRYWHMVGVKDHHQESLVGQAGEIEPVYDQYSLSFFLFEPSTMRLYLPQFAGVDGNASSLKQGLENGYLPIVITKYQPGPGLEIQQKVIATTVGRDQRSIVLVRFAGRLTGSVPAKAWLCVSISPTGPSGFQRHDKAGRYMADRRLTFLRYLQAENRVEVNSGWGPVFDAPPQHFGIYGNRDSTDPEHYVRNNPFKDLSSNGALNNQDIATDYVAGLCAGVFAWQIDLTPTDPAFSLNLRLPVDDYRGAGDLAELRTADPDILESDNRNYWINKLDRTGFQAALPTSIKHLFDLFRTCRANLLILSDNGEIHPGPTLYDSFWVRDSSVEGVACSLSGDMNLAERQFGYHYPGIFNFGFKKEDSGKVGPVRLHGFFGGEHEKNDREWDSNGQALWAIGRFDRIAGTGSSLGAKLFFPYVIEGARWIHDNRSVYGLLHSGWSAEHIGDKDKPHYWDDFWGLAGLWEAARLAERIGAREAAEIWRIYDDLKNSTADSICWTLWEQRRRGFWETFIPTGPGDVGRLDSTIIGAVSYFHPCRLYMGEKLGKEVDSAARMTLETIWAKFMDGGFRHDSAWNCYGPYLTLQLAHAFLLIGEVGKMDRCLSWVVSSAYAEVSRYPGISPDKWQAALGAWNEQHCYPVAKDFKEIPGRAWYMGDIPHGWACAEYMMLLRDILFFEADEDGAPHVYLAPGIMPHWLGDGESIRVSDAPTLFSKPFGFKLTHAQSVKTVEIEITQPLPYPVSYVYPCRYGTGLSSVTADGINMPFSGRDASLPAGAMRAAIKYY